MLKTSATGTDSCHPQRFPLAAWDSSRRWTCVFLVILPWGSFGIESECDLKGHPHTHKYIYICGTGFWGLFRSPGYIRPLGISPAPTILFRGTHHTLNAPNMPSPLNSSPCTHTQAIYFNLIIFWIYFFPILCPSLTLSGVLSLHLFRWARRTWQVAWFSANPSKTLKHPHFQHCFFSICNVPSTCLLSLTCFAQPLFLILHSHISQWISIPSTTDIPLSIDCLNWGKMPLMRFCAQHFQKKSINILWATLVPANYPQAF